MDKERREFGKYLTAAALYAIKPVVERLDPVANGLDTVANITQGVLDQPHGKQFLQVSGAAGLVYAILKTSQPKTAYADNTPVPVATGKPQIIAEAGTPGASATPKDIVEGVINSVEHPDEFKKRVKDACNGTLFVGGSLIGGALALAHGNRLYQFVIRKIRNPIKRGSIDLRGQDASGPIHI